jgi:hypothetical protein
VTSTPVQETPSAAPSTDSRGIRVLRDG